MNSHITRTKRLNKKNLFRIIKKLDYGSEAIAVILDMLSMFNPKWEKEIQDWMVQNEVLEIE